MLAPLSLFKASRTVDGIQSFWLLLKHKDTLFRSKPEQHKTIGTEEHSTQQETSLAKF